MKLPELLKQGILSGDWEIICKIYTSITGEHIEPSQPKEPNWADMDITLDTEEVTPTETIDSDVADSLVQEVWIETEPKPPKVGKGAQARRESMKIPEPDTRPNNFIDNLAAFSKECIDVSPQLGAIRHPRKTKVNAAITHVKCRSCGKEEDISISLATRYNPNPDDNTYKCNACCSSRGRMES